MRHNGIDTDEILAQMGITQWCLREPNRVSSIRPQEVDSLPEQPTKADHQNYHAPTQTRAVSTEAVALPQSDAERVQPAVEKVAPGQTPEAAEGVPEVAPEAAAMGEQTIDEPSAIQLQQFSGLQGSALEGSNWLIVQQSESDQRDQASGTVLYSNIVKALNLKQTTVQTQLNRSEFTSAIAGLNADLAIVFGQALGKALLPHEQEIPLLKVVPQQVGVTLIPLLVLPTLQHLLASPIEKRAVWEALKQAITLSQ